MVCVLWAVFCWFTLDGGLRLRLGGFGGLILLLGPLGLVVVVELVAWMVVRGCCGVCRLVVCLLICCVSRFWGLVACVVCRRCGFAGCFVTCGL